MHRIASAVTLCLVLGAGAPALAQSEADFVAAFAGNWQTLEPALSDGGACRVQLRADRTAQTAAGRYALVAQRCAGALAGVASWGIVDNQLGLVDAGGGILARLGGNQARMSGDLAAGGGPVVFERVSAPGGGDVAAARTASGSGAGAGCVFYGYTASCARAEDRQAPLRTGIDDTARVAVLVALNARAEARPDADVVATIPAGTCVVVDQCTSASDGNWCRATVSSFSAWIRQEALRANRWPVLTFAPRCAARGS